MDEGIRRAARYSLPTAELRYCGPAVAPDALRAAVRGGPSAPAADALLRFEALVPYLEVIAEETGRAPLDPDVVETYWLGGPLLDRDWRPSFARIVERLAQRGLPRSFAQRLAARVPAQAIPHHAFHVLFVGVGRVTGHVETTLPNMDACRPSLAVVTARDARGLMVERAPLAWRDGRFALDAPVAARAAYDADLTPIVAPGDRIAMHWGVAVERLDARAAEILGRATARAIDAANATLT